jgi:hypothetical protein
MERDGALGNSAATRDGMRVVTGLPFCVHAWSAWAPGRESEGAWRSWAGQASDDRPDTPPEPAPLLLRRRVSALGQKLLKAAWSLPEAASARIVLCSRHGEFGRTLSILDALASRTEISPADFTLSVHNALAGLLSIARANRGGHTCIAAGDESFGFGMLEALACLAERPEEPVLLLYFDEQLPAPFEAFDPDAPAPIALALHLTADAGERFRLATLPALAEPAGEPGAIAFLRVLLGAATASVTNGEQLLWQWRRDDAAA